MVRISSPKRAQIAFLATEKGLSIAEIARTIGVDYNTAKTWAERAVQGVLLHDKKRSGRKPKTSPSQRKKILRTLQTDKYGSIRKTASRVGGISRGTVHRIVKASGIKAWKKTRKPYLSNSHRKRRLTFARKYKGTDWGKWLFTDEHSLGSFKGGQGFTQYVWSEKKPQNPAPTVKSSASIHIFGGISSKGKTPLSFYEKKLDQEELQGILISNVKPSLRALYPGGGYVFMHDGDSAFTAQSTQEWCKENLDGYLKKGEWPANSPDLSPIENLWRVLNMRVYQRKCKNLAGFKNVVREEWNKISQSDIQKLIDSMDDRCRAVIRAKGGHTKY